MLYHQLETRHARLSNFVLVSAAGELEHWKTPNEWLGLSFVPGDLVQNDSPHAAGDGKKLLPLGFKKVREGIMCEVR